MQIIGRYFLFLHSLIIKRESFNTYVRLIIDECIKVGINSIFIVAIVSTFIGAVTAVQTAYNIVSPLIPNYVVSLVVRDMTLLELAPTITAIVFAGKVGSNISGELGTMRISEQIDALEVMGINSSSFLVLPKIIACLLMYPLLVILAGFLALIGGYLAATLTGAMTPDEFIYGIRADFIEYNVTFALIKSVVFAFLISSISAFTGYFTIGGALEVGRASTKAVTSSCIAILSADYLLAQLLL
ncbi:MAG: ABC transporter permease [Cyclobacteriaceae bacterium]|nr:ABC transporter permease [Cyclobacteriaceae bacterium]